MREQQLLPHNGLKAIEIKQKRLTLAEQSLKPKLLSVAVAFCLGFSGTTFAGLQIIESDSKAEPVEIKSEKSEKSKGTDRHVTHRGKQPDRVATVSGFGDDVPLETAVDMIVPTGWTAQYSSDVQRDTLVSWNDGLRWTEIVGGFLNDHTVQVDWDNQKVVFSAQQAISEDADGLNWTEVDTESNVVTRKERRLPSAASAAGQSDQRPIASTQQRYVLKEGEMLSDALYRVGKANGWHVHWPYNKGLPEYKIRRNASFQSDDFVGFIRQVVDAYQDAGGMKNVVAIVSRYNKTVAFDLSNSRN